MLKWFSIVAVINVTQKEIVCNTQNKCHCDETISNIPSYVIIRYDFWKTENPPLSKILFFLNVSHWITTEGQVWLSLQLQIKPSLRLEGKAGEREAKKLRRRDCDYLFFSPRRSMFCVCVRWLSIILKPLRKSKEKSSKALKCQGLIQVEVLNSAQFCPE